MKPLASKKKTSKAVAMSISFLIVHYYYVAVHVDHKIDRNLFPINSTSFPPNMSYKKSPMHLRMRESPDSVGQHLL